MPIYTCTGRGSGTGTTKLGGTLANKFGSKKVEEVKGSFVFHITCFKVFIFRVTRKLPVKKLTISCLQE